MMAALDEYVGSIARSSVMALNLPDWSMRTPSVPFLVTLISIHEPRSGMMRHECSLASPSISMHEIDAGRTVQLADDDAFGAVDDELAAADHDRHVAEIDFFLDDRAIGLAQAQPDLERPAVGEAQLPAFVGVVARLAEFVLHVFESDLLVVALDREDFLASPLPGRRGAARPAASPAGGTSCTTRSARR